MRARKFGSLPGASRVAPPPNPEESAQRAQHRAGCAVCDDREAGFKAWMKSESKRRGKRICVLLEDIRAAYEKVHGLNK